MHDGVGMAPAKFTLEAEAAPVDLQELFQRISAHCRRMAVRAALVHVDGRPQLSGEQLLSAVRSLEEAFAEGFKIGWVCDDRTMYERLVETEYPLTRSGIQSRVFFEESNANRWLAW